MRAKLAVSSRHSAASARERQRRAARKIHAHRAAALGLCTARASRCARLSRRRGSRLGEDAHRCLYARPAQKGRPEALARGRPRYADPPRHPSILPDCRLRLPRSPRSSRTARPMPGRSWSSGCSPARIMASAGDSTGSTWSASPSRDGFEYDTHRRDAWRYRDYVIRAFNNDKPYDRFLPEQLAGDEIAPAEDETLIAVGVQPPGAAAQERRQPGSRQQPQRSADGDDQHRRLGAPGRDARLRALPRS